MAEVIAEVFNVGAAIDLGVSDLQTSSPEVLIGLTLYRMLVMYNNANALTQM